MALFTSTAKLDPGAHSARCAWAMAVHHAVGISHHRNSGYRPIRVNIMAQGLWSSLSLIQLSIRRGRSTTTHYMLHQVSLVVACNTTLVSSLGLHTGPACEAGLSAGMWREQVPPQWRKKERKITRYKLNIQQTSNQKQVICKHLCKIKQNLKHKPYYINRWPKTTLVWGKQK